MPIDYSKYPANWKTEIRPRILKRAADCCEFCGVPNHYIIMRHFKNGAIYRVTKFSTVAQGVAELENRINISPGLIMEMAFWKRPIKGVLTIAHLDHKLVDHSDENLAALCQRCHLRYDAKARKAAR